MKNLEKLDKVSFIFDFEITFFQNLGADFHGESKERALFHFLSQKMKSCYDRTYDAYIKDEMTLEESYEKMKSYFDDHTKEFLTEFKQLYLSNSDKKMPFDAFYEYILSSFVEYGYSTEEAHFVLSYLKNDLESAYSNYAEGKWIAVFAHQYLLDCNSRNYEQIGKALSEAGLKDEHVSHQEFIENFFENYLSGRIGDSGDSKLEEFIFLKITPELDRAYREYLEDPMGNMGLHLNALQSEIFEVRFRDLELEYRESHSNSEV